MELRLPVPKFDFKDIKDLWDAYHKVVLERLDSINELLKVTSKRQEDQQKKIEDMPERIRSLIMKDIDEANDRMKERIQELEYRRLQPLESRVGVLESRFGFYDEYYRPSKPRSQYG